MSFTSEVTVGEYRLFFAKPPPSSRKASRQELLCHYSTLQHKTPGPDVIIISKSTLQRAKNRVQSLYPRDYVLYS